MAEVGTASSSAVHHGIGTPVTGAAAATTTLDIDEMSQSSVSSMAKSEMEQLKEMIKKMQQEIIELKKEVEKNEEMQDKNDNHEDPSIILKPLNFKDIKAPIEYGGEKHMFLSWHESFTTML